MTEYSKLFIFAGIALIAAGLIFSGKIPFLGKLPGDILIKKDGFTFFFPIVTSIVLSIILTIILNLMRK